MQEFLDIVAEFWYFAVLAVVAVIVIIVAIVVSCSNKNKNKESEGNANANINANAKQGKDEVVEDEKVKSGDVPSTDKEDDGANEQKQSETKEVEKSNKTQTNAKATKSTTKKSSTTKSGTKVNASKKADDGKGEATEEKETAVTHKEPKKESYRVIYDKVQKDWVIKKDGASRATKRVATKEEALKIAKQLSVSHDANISVHKKDGKFQKKSNVNM